MTINKDTQLCISIAARPSNFGTTIHNAAYRALGVNFIYKAFAATDIEGVVAGVRALGIRGCSVSMPFKETVIPFLDEVDPAAEAIGAVNTVVNENGKLVGYNTDAAGARKLLEILGVTPTDEVLLLGAGGVSRAMLYALAQLSVASVQITNRDAERARRLAERHRATLIPWQDREQSRATVVLNATSIGMAPDVAAAPLDVRALGCCRALGDVVVSPMETSLIRAGRIMGKRVAPGYLMSLEQAAVQIFLYTKQEAPRPVIEQALNELLK